MGDVIAFRGKSEPHLRGPARCMRCDHRWEAVSPEGVISSFECPECGLFTGVFEGVTEPEHGTRWVCNCGSDLFYILPDYCQCLMCGVVAKGF
jgi:hypothetical protein